MLLEHLKVARRNIRRHRAQSMLNASGLALGLATFLLIAVYVHDEWSYDRFHEKADRIYRLAGDYSGEAGVRSFARIPPAVVPLLTREIPEVEAGIRFQSSSATIRTDTEVFQEREYFFADAAVFDIFSFPFIAGNPKTALEEPYTLVITASTAERYFGTTNALGRTVVLQDTLTYTVTGVTEDVPAQSHLNFNVLASFESFRRMRPDVEMDELWSWGTFYSYVLLRPGSDVASVDARIVGAIDAARGETQFDGTRFDAKLQPVTSIHLYSTLRQEMSPGGNATYLTIFGVIAVLVLLIAGINFVNLATARGARRAREVGVRKAVGASQQQLITQFMVEAVATSVFALVIAFALVALILPAFNQLAGKAIAVSTLGSPAFLFSGLILALLTGVLAGGYPAFFLSGFRPVAVLKSGSSGAVGGARLRQALVVVQFTTSIFLIGGTLVAVSQVDHLKNHDLGLAKDQVVVMPFYWETSVQDRYESLREQLLELPGVEAVTSSGDVPGRMFTSMGIWGEGMQQGSSVGANALIVDPDFAETYGLELAAGRDFSAEFPTDWDDAFMLNESAAELLGWTPEEAIGKSLAMNNTGTVVGVFKDFYYVGVQEDVEPIVMAMWPSWFGYVSVRLADVSSSRAVAQLQATWQRVLPDRPFEMFFLDDDFDRQYRAEAQFGSVFVALALLAILIACLGLYGLAAFMTERRIKEIGVRKALGAGVGSLTTMLSRSFAQLIATSFAIATPVTFFAMDQWLMGFDSRVSLSIWTFLLAGGLAFTIALSTVSFHTIRAARANPVTSLRYE